MNAEVINHAIQEMIETAEAHGKDYMGRMSSAIIPEGDDLECLHLATHYFGGAAHLRELAFRLSLLTADIESEV